MMGVSTIEEITALVAPVSEPVSSVINIDDREILSEANAIVHADCNTQPKHQ